jgi:glycosyltransferase involved in cell wall biosynthesis
MKSPTYAVITPVRDEGPYVGRTIESVANQTIRPARWVIVNDGSTDDTPAILDAAAAKYSWITAVHRANRGARANGGGVVDTFNDGYARLADVTWDFLVKLDADLSFEPAYFARCFAHFAAEPRLGIGGGTICIEQEGRAVVESPGDPPFHVRGATKIYRRECWAQIGPLVRAAGWDTVDEVKANMHGWSTRTFPELPLLQHKVTGSADGTWRNAFKNGRANYVTGYDPLFMVAKCFKRMFSSPPVVCGVAMAAGFCSGYANRLPQVGDVQAIRYLRQQQRRRLFLRESIYG